MWIDQNGNLFIELKVLGLKNHKYGPIRSIEFKPNRTWRPETVLQISSKSLLSAQTYQSCPLNPAPLVSFCFTILFSVPYIVIVTFHLHTPWQVRNLSHEDPAFWLLHLLAHANHWCTSKRGVSWCRAGKSQKWSTRKKIKRTVDSIPTPNVKLKHI